MLLHQERDPKSIRVFSHVHRVKLNEPGLPSSFPPQRYRAHGSQYLNGELI